MKTGLTAFLSSWPASARVQPWKFWSTTRWCRTSFWVPRRQEEVLSAVFSQADVCNKSGRSGELHSIWHVRFPVQVGVKKKKPNIHKNNLPQIKYFNRVIERETGAGKMMKRVPRLRSGTFSQPAAKTLTSFRLHFGQISSRLQSQWDLGGQRRRHLHVACKNSKSVKGGGGRGGGGGREEERVALKDLSVQQVMSAEGGRMDSSEVSCFHPGPDEMCAHAPRTWPTHFPSYFDICPVAGPHVSGPGSRQGRVFCSKCEFIKESGQNLKVPCCAIFTVLRNDMWLLSAEKQTPFAYPPSKGEQSKSFSSLACSLVALAG